MPVVPPGLHHVRARTEPHFGLSFRRLDIRPREECDLHGVSVRVKGNGKSCRQLEAGAERLLGMVPPQIRDLDYIFAGRYGETVPLRSHRCCPSPMRLTPSLAAGLAIALVGGSVFFGAQSRAPAPSPAQELREDR